MIDRTYYIGRYLDDPEEGEKFAVRVFVNDDHVRGIHLMSFDKLCGYLEGISEYPRDIAKIHFKNGFFQFDDTRSPMGNKILPLEGKKLEKLIKKFSIFFE